MLYICEHPLPSAPMLNLTDAAKPAHNAIMAEFEARMKRPDRPVEVRAVVIGRADGYLVAETPSTRYPDVEIFADNERYTLTVFGEPVRGLNHTLSRVLLTRLARHAANIPANRKA